jgi:hypothetical protein
MQVSDVVLNIKNLYNTLIRIRLQDNFLKKQQPPYHLPGV